MQVLNVEKEHAVEVMLDSSSKLNSILYDIIGLGEIEENTETKLYDAVNDVLSSIEYLWIQTGISLPAKADREVLIKNLRDYAADLKIKINREASNNESL